MYVPCTLWDELILKIPPMVVWNPSWSVLHLPQQLSLAASSALSGNRAHEVSGVSMQLVYALNWVESLSVMIRLSLSPHSWCVKRTITGTLQSL